MSGALGGGGQFTEPEQYTHRSPLRSRGDTGALFLATPRVSPAAPLSPAQRLNGDQEGIANKLSAAVRIQEHLGCL